MKLVPKALYAMPRWCQLREIFVQKRGTRNSVSSAISEQQSAGRPMGWVDTQEKVALLSRLGRQLDELTPIDLPPSLLPYC